MISFDIISYKIIKAPSDFFTPFVTKTTNKGLTWKLPEKANAASVILFLRLVSVLNIFYKTYEWVIKYQNIFCHEKIFSTKLIRKEENLQYPKYLNISYCEVEKKLGLQASSWNTSDPSAYGSNCIPRKV